MSILQDLVDGVTGIAKKVADFELDKRSLDLLLAREARAAEGATNARRAGAQVQAQETITALLPFLILAGVGVAGFIVIKQFD